MNSDYLNDPEFKKLIIKFLDYVKKSLMDVTDSIENEDFQSLHKFGHELKGSSAIYGFKNLQENGQEIMNFADQRNITQIGTIIKNIQTFVTNEKELRKDDL